MITHSKQMQNGCYKHSNNDMDISMLMDAAQPGPRLNIKTAFPRYGDSHLKIRRSRDRLIFNMGIPILVRRHLYFETDHRIPNRNYENYKIVASRTWAKCMRNCNFQLNMGTCVPSVLSISFLILVKCVTWPILVSNHVNDLPWSNDPVLTNFVWNVMIMPEHQDTFSMLIANQTHTHIHTNTHAHTHAHAHRNNLHDTPCKYFWIKRNDLLTVSSNVLGYFINHNY